MNWVDHNLRLAQQLMKSSAQAGDGRGNFAAHNAHHALKAAKDALGVNAELRAEIERLQARRLLLVKSDCSVRDDRWAITIDASGETCSMTVTHKQYGDFYDWLEVVFGHDCRGGACPAADRAYTLQDESNFRTRSAALSAAHDFLRRFGAGEIEYLEYDADSQTKVVVGHGNRRGMRGWMAKDWDDKPDPLAPFYVAHVGGQP